MAAAHISDTGAALQFVDRTVERRQPAVDQIIVIAGPEKSSDGTEKTARLVAPRHPVAGLECRLDQFLAVQHRGHKIECAEHVNRAVLDREHHRLFFRQCKFLGRRLVGQIVRRSLMRRPFACSALYRPKASPIRTSATLAAPPKSDSICPTNSCSLVSSMFALPVQVA